MKKFFAIFLFLTISGFSFSQSLYINELVAVNNNGSMDDFFQTDDWIEIYNAGGIINLAGYYLTDDPTNLTKWLVPSTNLGLTYLLPGAHLILWADNDINQGEDHIGFTLSSDGETIILVAPDGSTIIDSVTYPLMAPDISYGRSCDGCGTWEFFNTPTFEATNAQAPTTSEILFINEVQTVNTSTYYDMQYQFDQWFEVYNPNPYQVNIAGYDVTINGQNFVIPNTNPYWTVIPAQGFLAIWCDGDLANQTNHLPFGLPLEGSTIILGGPDDALVDQMTYPSMTSDQSFGRQSDGSPTLTAFIYPTPRVSNTTSFISPANILINEVLPKNITGIVDNYNELEDWFEVYNPTNTPVNLSGYYFTDNPETPTKWQVPSTFPDSVTVPANGYRLFWADEDGIQGVLHASFKLLNNGECVALYSPDGYTLVDEICWTYINQDESYGRITDGNDSWWMFIVPTPEASNGEGVLGTYEVDIVSLIAYPNPTNSMLHFNRISSFVALNSSGQMIGQWKNIGQLDVSLWPSGLYLLKDEMGHALRIVKD